MATHTLRSIERFSDCLFMVASMSDKDFMPKEDERITLHLLKAAGFVSFEAFADGKMRYLQITPAGAQALVQWRDLIASNSLTGKLLDIVEKALWLALGALMSIVGTFVQAQLGLIT